MRGIALCVVGLLIVAVASPAARDEVRPVPIARQQEAQPKPGENKDPTGKPSPDRTTRPGDMRNVRLDVTIADQRASGQPTTKTVSLVLASGSQGRIRTTGEVRVSATGQIQPVILNIDANPHVTPDNRVRAAVTLEYRPTVAVAASEDQALTTISETFTVLLEDGKPLVVSQSADPTTDRRVRVEVKATILK